MIFDVDTLSVLGQEELMLVLTLHVRDLQYSPLVTNLEGHSFLLFVITISDVRCIMGLGYNDVSVQSFVVSEVLIKKLHRTYCGYCSIRFFLTSSHIYLFHKRYIRISFTERILRTSLAGIFCVCSLPT